MIMQKGLLINDKLKILAYDAVFNIVYACINNFIIYY